MKKNILVKLASIAAAASLLVGGAYAAFNSSQVTITGVSVTSATPSLKVWNGSSWQDTANAANLDISETNMYPGWVGKWHTFSLYNQTGGAVPFAKVIANVVGATGGNWDALKDVVKMEFRDNTSSYDSGPQTLSWWYTHQWNILGGTQFADATQRDFQVRFSMDPTTDDKAKGQNVVVTIGLVAQTP